MPLRVRQRNISIAEEAEYLPEFNIANVCNANARIDRFDLTFPGRAINYDNPANLDEDIDELVTSGIFKRSGNRRNSLEIRKKWLVSSPVMKPIGFFRDIAGNHNITLKLSLNFTRFFQSNPEAIGIIRGKPVDYALIADEEALKAISQHTLDGNDNIFSGSRWREMSDLGAWIRVQLSKTRQFIDQSLILNPADDLDALWDGEVSASSYRLDWSDWSLSHLEVYYDFRVEDALSFLNQLSPQVTELFDNKKRQYNHEFKKNGASIVVDLPNHVQLSIYAKTQNRLRVEVRFKESLRSRFSRPTRDIGREFEDVPQMIEFGVTRATAILRKFVGQIRLDNQARTPPVYDFSSFAGIIGKITNSFVRNQILSPLIQNGSVVECDRTKAAIEQLCRQGVLERVKVVKRSPNKRYRITKRYMKITEAIKNIS